MNAREKVISYSDKFMIALFYLGQFLFAMFVFNAFFDVMDYSMVAVFGQIFLLGTANFAFLFCLKVALLIESKSSVPVTK